MQVQQTPASQANPAELENSQPATPLQKPSPPLSDIQSSINSLAQSIQQAIGQTAHQPTSGLYQAISSLVSFVSSTLRDLNQLLQSLLNPPPTIIETPSRPETPLTNLGSDAVNTPGNSTVTPNETNVGGGADGGSGSGNGSGVGNGGGTSGSDTPIDTGTPGVGQPGNEPKVSLVPGHAREFDRTGEIEWRPRLNDGKLQMIFRPEHINLADKVEIYSPDGTTLLATGTKAGNTADGRPIYNFDRTGGDFPDNALVVMTFKDNKGVRRMTIPDTAEKYVHGTPAGTGPGNTNTSVTPPAARQLIPTKASEFDKTGEIEWRPTGNNGNLSMTFRKAHDTMAEKVEIISPDGTKVLATGVRAGSTADGRPIYKFDKPGASFPDGSTVLMTFKNGEGHRKLKIDETSEKYTHGTPKVTSGGSNGGGSSSSGGSSVGAGGGTGPTSGAGNPPPSSLIPAHATEFEATGTIEWRPRLNNNKLSIIFRKAHLDLAESVKIYSPDGTTLLATGTYSGKTSDGRPIYNFDKAGGDFPANAVVVMTFKNNGGARRMTIPTPADKVVR